jgi:hypothetical protein
LANFNGANFSPTLVGRANKQFAGKSSQIPISILISSTIVASFTLYNNMLLGFVQIEETILSHTNLIRKNFQIEFGLNSLWQTERLNLFYKKNTFKNLRSSMNKRFTRFSQVTLYYTMKENRKVFLQFFSQFFLLSIRRYLHSTHRKQKKPDSV